MKNHTNLIEKLRSSGAEKVKIAATDIDGILRGKYVSMEKFLGILDGGFGFCDVVFGWDCGDVAYDNVTVSGWHTGYPDAKALIDVSTFRQVPWEEDVPFFLADFDDPNSVLRKVCPRTLLKQIRKQAENEGYSAVFSQEFEWFNFAENPDSIHEKGYKNLKTLSPGMFGYSVLRASQNAVFFADLFDGMAQYNLPIEGLHTETGPGVLEAAITYSEVLEAADRAVLFKSGTKEIGHKHGVMPTFMAKISEHLPGCSGHVHQSLWKEDANLFFDASKLNNVSPLMESYIAGQLHCLPHILPMFAPTVNSYKRLVVGAWAPTTLTWAVDNRTVALRALPGGKKSARLETRVVGSDSNPYLAMAACLASGLYGVLNKLKLQVPETKGNGYLNTSNGVLPGNLLEASEKMANSEVAKGLFGKEFVAHFTQTRFWEWKQFSKSVTDWETKRYFEII